MSYVRRYINGEHTQVWDELLQLGPAVREESVYHDAMAVASETMVRVHQNIETLIARLIQLGFVFGYDQRLLTPLVSSDTVQKYITYKDMFSWVQKQPPVFLDAHVEKRRSALKEIDPFLSDWEEEVESLERKTGSWSVPAVETLAHEFGPIPLSVHAWYTEMGAVNFYGYFARWDELVHATYPRSSHKRTRRGTFIPSGLMQHCDPLQVRALDEQALEELSEKQTDRNNSQREFEFAPDRFFKDYAGGGQSHYTFLFPDAGADTSVYGMTFVEYLRLSLLQYAGFPGMAEWPVKPEEDLTLLTEGLIPF